MPLASSPSALSRRALRASLVLACLGALSVSREAAAQNAATAEALFKKGMADFNAKKFDTACPALEESYRVDPRAGSLFTSAECYAEAGKVATAASLYEQFERFVDRMPANQRGGQAERLKVAAEKRAALKPRIPSLTLTLAAGAPDNAVVKRDGTVVGKPTMGVAIPVDPGEHVLVTYVEGGPTKEQKINVKEGEAKKVELVVDTGAKTPTSSAPPAAPATSSSASASTTGPSAPPPSSRKTIGFVAGGIGAAALIGGGVAGILSMSKKKTVDEECNGKSCTPAGKEAADSGKTLATVSTIGVAVGVVGIAAGVYLVVSAPKADTAANARFIAPTVAPLAGGGGLLGAVGRF